MLRNTAMLFGSAALLALVAQEQAPEQNEIDGSGLIVAQSSECSEAPAAPSEGLRVRTTARASFLGAGGGTSGNHGLRVRSAVRAA